MIFHIRPDRNLPLHSIPLNFGIMGLCILGKKFRCYGKIFTHYNEFGVMTIRYNGNIFIGVMTIQFNGIHCNQ